MTRRPWTHSERRALRLMYPHMRTDDIAHILGRMVGPVYQQAQKLGLSNIKGSANQ